MLPGGCWSTGLPKPLGGWLPFVGVRLEGICGGLPKPDGGGVLLNPLGTGGGLKLGAGGGLKPLGDVVGAVGGCDSVDGVELGAGLVAVVLGAGPGGAPVDAGASVPVLAGGGGLTTVGAALVGPAGAGMFVVAAGVEVEVEEGVLDPEVPVPGSVGGDD